MEQFIATRPNKKKCGNPQSESAFNESGKKDKAPCFHQIFGLLAGSYSIPFLTMENHRGEQKKKTEKKEEKRTKSIEIRMREEYKKSEEAPSRNIINSRIVVGIIKSTKCSALHENPFAPVRK